MPKRVLGWLLEKQLLLRLLLAALLAVVGVLAAVERVSDLLWLRRVHVGIPVGTSGTARTPQVRPSSPVQQLAVARRTEEDWPGGASVVPLQDMNT